VPTYQLHRVVAGLRKEHSTNAVERLHGEIKRRSRVVGILPHRASVNRLIGMLLVELDDERAVGERRYFSAESMALNPQVPRSRGNAQRYERRYPSRSDSISRSRRSSSSRLARIFSKASEVAWAKASRSIGSLVTVAAWARAWISFANSRIRTMFASIDTT
jgi:hypothetical protein